MPGSQPPRQAGCRRGQPINKPNQATETVKAAQALGVRAIAIQADSADPEAVVATVATQAAVKHMKEGGRIINIGSCNAERIPRSRDIGARVVPQLLSRCVDRTQVRRPQEASVLRSQFQGLDRLAAFPVHQQ